MCGMRLAYALMDGIIPIGNEKKGLLRSSRPSRNQDDGRVQGLDLNQRPSGYENVLKFTGR
jgi:hypothetical protein